MDITAQSPVEFGFDRHGGADVQAEVQIWMKKDSYASTDRPVLQVRFSNPLQVREAQRVTLPAGNYTCVFLCMVREALNGSYSFRLVIAGNSVYDRNGDANATSNPGDIVNFREDIGLSVV